MSKPTLFDEMRDGMRRVTVAKANGFWRTQVRYCGVPVWSSSHSTWADAITMAVAAVAR